MTVVQVLLRIRPWLRLRLDRLLGRSPVIPPPAPPQPPVRLPQRRAQRRVQPVVPTPRIAPPQSRKRQPVQPRPRPGRIGRILGGGGQGSVHELEGDPTRVVKQFPHPIPDVDEDFQRLIDAGPVLTSSLGGLPIALCWPERAVPAESGLAGYVMPRMGKAFYFEYHRKDRLRTLDFAVPKVSAHALPFTVNDADRLALVQLVAVFLESMHAAGLVYGDLSWGNFSFAPGPKVQLSVYDVDSSRQLGTRSFTRQPPAHTADWDDPLSPHLPVATLDADRYKFALLAFRLLVSRNFDGRISPAQCIAPIPGLTDQQSHDLKSLWTRAAGPPGTRPQLSEWTRLLGRPKPSSALATSI